MITAAIVLAYFAVGTVTAGVARHVAGQDGEELSILVGLIWPVMLPIIAMYRGSTLVGRALDARATRKALPAARTVNVLADRSITYPVK